MEIVVYNRAIWLFTTDSEVVNRIHQVCCWLDDMPPVSETVTHDRQAFLLTDRTRV